MNCIGSKKLSVLLSLAIAAILAVGYFGAKEDESGATTTEGQANNVIHMEVAYG